MMEFSLTIDLGLKERSNPHATVPRAFISRALTAVAAEILDENRYGPAVHQTAPARAGTIVDDKGVSVGGWKLSIKSFRSDEAA